MKESLYLKRLKFDKNLLNSGIGKYLGNIRVVLLILMTVIVAGLVSFSQLPRRLNPELKIPIVLVTTILPGAGPTDVESLITIPLENEIKGISEIDTLSSTSSEGISSIIIEFSSSVDAKSARDDVQKAVDSVNDLPDDATTPQVQELDFEDQPIITFAVTSENSILSLYRFGDILEEELEALSKVDRVEINGKEPQQVNIVISPSKLRQYNINPIELGQKIKAELSSYPSGVVESETLNYQLTVDPLITDIPGLRDVQIELNGKLIQLGEIAEIIEYPDEATTIAYIADNDIDPTRALTMSVYKTINADIDDASADIEELLQSTFEDNETYTIYRIDDTGKLIEEQFNELFTSTLITILLVFATLFVFLGIRQALVASMSIPLTFLIAFIVMNVSGLTLNFLTLFSLLLALGLVVDDAIVIISATTQYYRGGKFTPLETGILVWKDFSIPIWTTTLTTVWAFLPLLLASGLIGEFIKSIPIVVSTTLIASTTIAVFITLPVMVALLKFKIPNRLSIFIRITFAIIVTAALFNFLPKTPIFPIIVLVYFALLFVTFQLRKQSAEKITKTFKSQNWAQGLTHQLRKAFDSGLIDFTKVAEKYNGVITNIIGNKKNLRRTILIVILFSLFSYMLVPLGFVPNEFFPKTDEDIIYIEIELPTGTTLSVTEIESLKVLEQVRNKEYIELVTLDVGRGVDLEGGGAGPSSENLSLMTLRLVNEKLRDQTSSDISANLRQELSGTQSWGKISVVEVSGGPPAGADIQIKLLGDDLELLNIYSDKIVTYLEEQEGLNTIAKSVSPSPGKLSFIPDRAKLANNKLTTSDVGFWLRTYASGFDIKSARIDNSEEIDIVLKTDIDRKDPASIGALFIPTVYGSSASISDLGEIVLLPNPTLITRENGQRTISVVAGVDALYNIGEINSALEKYADAELDLPSGYSWQTGGVNEENQKSVQSIIQAMALSAILILATMVIQLSSFRKALIVLLVIPLGISGVFIMFSLTNTPLSFPALIGVLALFGIVVNNSIVLVEKINQNLASKMKFNESIIDAATSRIEPIAFSSITTIMGLIPITLTDALWRGLGGAIISGLMFSGTIMLFFIPAVYYLMFRNDFVKENDSN